MKIADNVEFDLEKFRGQRLILQGASGSGKSNGARLILEATYGSFQQIIIDVEDEFHTLRTPDRDYAIIGDSGDAPLSKKQDAGALAQTLLKIGLNSVLQIGDWTLSEKRGFIGNFIAGMMSAKSDLWHPVIVMLDEVHNYAPNMATVESSEAITHLATAGRKRGFSMIIATQRMSLISKDVLGQCENKFLGRVEQALDRRAAAELVGFSASSADARDMQGFKPGEFYVVGPALTQMPTRAQLYKAATEAPKPGTTVLPSATPHAIQAALSALAKASEPVVEDKPAAQAAQMSDDSIKTIRQDGYDAGYAKGVEDGQKQGYDAARQNVGRRVQQIGEEILGAPIPSIEEIKRVWNGMEIVQQGQVKTVLLSRADPPTKEDYEWSEQPSAPPEVTTTKISPSSRKIVEAIIAAFPIGMTLERAAKRAGLSTRSSAFRRYLAEAAHDPRIEERAPGRYFAIEADSTVKAPAGLSAFKEKLPPSYGRMLEVIEASSPGEVSRGDIAAGAAVSPKSSGLNAGLKELEALGLIEASDRGYTLSPDFR